MIFPSRLVCASLLALLVLFSPVTRAQSDRGTITGTVSDPGDAVVPNAAVTVRNVDTGSQFQTTTTGTGNFTLTSLPAGRYEVGIEAPGFNKFLQSNITVQVALTVRIDAVLKVGATSETVNVTAAAPMLRTENAEQSVNITGDRINALPINVGSSGAIRNPFDFIILSPGVTGTGMGARLNGFGGNQFRVLLEGQDTTSGNAIARANETQASVESLQEFTLQTSNYSAEYGQALSGVFNFTSRSGTNQFHGSGYEYFVNEALNSYTGISHIRPVSRKHNGGFTVGGPIAIPKIYNGRDKTFFFFSWEFFRNRQLPSNNLATVPTEAFRRGDFSSILGAPLTNVLDPNGRPILANQIYDPQSSRLVNGQVVRDPFPGNIIPTSRIDPVAAKIQALIPAADIPGNVFQNWYQSEPNTKYQHIPSIKLDHNFRDSSKASFYYSKQKTDQVSSNDSLPVPITARRDQFIYAHTSRLNYDHSLSPTLLVHAGVGFVRYLNPDSSPASVLGDYDAVTGIGFRGGATNGFPRITGLANGNFGGMSLGLGPTNANHYFNDKFTSILSMTNVRNSHTFKFGGELKIDIWTDRNSRGSTGVLGFGSAQTGLPWITTSNTVLSGGNVGHGYASFLLGLVDNASVNAVQDPQWRKKGLAFYAQDTWKATRRLTLDYGLRWDYQEQGHEIFYRNSQFGPNVVNPSAGGLRGGTVYEGYGPGRCDCTFTEAYPFAFGPRLGLAYQINDKTVLRAGWGITYSSLPGYGYLTNASILGVGFDQKSWASPGAGEAAVLLRDGLQYNLSELYVPSLDPGVRPSPASNLNEPSQMIDPNGARPARVNQWNIGLQRELLQNLTVEAAYVANRGVWETASSMAPLNVLSTQRLAAFGLDVRRPEDRALLAGRIDSADAIRRGFTKPFPAFPNSGTVRQAIRPYPQFNNDLQQRWAPVGNSWYDSLQVKVTKRYSHGLDVSSAFTWQKELTLTGAYNDVFNRQNQKRLEGTPIVFTTAFNYMVPRLRANKWIGNLLGDWTVGGILRYQTGGYIDTPGSRNNLNNQIGQGTVMNRVPGQPLFLKDPDDSSIDPKKDLILNPAAWADPAPGEWGTAARNYSDYRGRRVSDEQLSLGRNFRIKAREGMMIHIRAEFFNVLNRINHPSPSSGDPTAQVTRNAAGDLTGGFGFINPANVGTNPRNGQLVARFTW